MGPGQKGWNDDARAFAASGWCEDQHMAGAAVAKMAIARAAVPASQVDSGAPISRKTDSKSMQSAIKPLNDSRAWQKVGPAKVSRSGPARGAVEVGSPSKDIAPRDRNGHYRGRRDHGQRIDCSAETRFPERRQLGDRAPCEGPDQPLPWKVESVNSRHADKVRT